MAMVYASNLSFYGLITCFQIRTKPQSDKRPDGNETKTIIRYTILTQKVLEYIYEYCFTSLSAQSWQYRDRRKPEAGTIPYSFFG